MTKLKFYPAIWAVCPTLVLSCIGALMLFQPAFAAGLDNGQQLYLTHCAGCHGNNGVSTMPDAPNFSRAKLFTQSDESLIDLVRSGRNMMPAYLGILSDREILNVINYARGFR